MAKGRRALDGYSLIEIIFVLGMILIIFAITAPLISKTNVDRTEVRAAAMSLTEDLRYLRQRAVTTMVPAALVIPNANLQKGHAQGYLLKEGFVGTRVLKVVDFTKLYKKVSLFVGGWQLDTAELHNPTLETAVTPILKYSNSGACAAGVWGGGATDYIFLFAPDGSVCVNGNMPHFDNAYHLVVGEYYAYAPTSFTGAETGQGNLTTWYSLTDVWRPVFSVTLTPAGEVSFAADVTGLAASAYREGGPRDPGEGAPLASIYTSNPTNYPPSISSVQIFPKINRLVFPEASGIDATVRLDGTLRILVKARDPDGQQLYIKPKSEAGAGSGDAGTFSHSAERFLSMSYDAAEDSYVGALDWTPPPSQPAGRQYVLTFTVSDGDKEVREVRKVLTIRKDKILFVSNRDKTDTICVMNTDGSGNYAVPYRPMGESYPSWFPDNKKIIFSAKRDQDANRIWVLDADCGKDLRSLTETSSPDSDSAPALSVDGTRVLFTRSSPSGKDDVYIMSAGGSTPKNLTNGQGNSRHPAWFKSDAAIKMAFTSDRSGRYQLYALELVPQGSRYRAVTTELAATSSNDTRPVWSPDGAKIAFESDRDGNPEIYVMNADGTGQTRLTKDPGATNSYPSWSPDSAMIVFESTRDGDCEVYMMNADGTNQVNLSNNPQADDKMPSWVR